MRYEYGYQPGEEKMEFGKAVWYVGDGGTRSLAFVTATDEGEGDLVVLTEDGVVYHDAVARRAPGEYGPEGGGHTWHLQSESAG